MIWMSALSRLCSMLSLMLALLIQAAPLRAQSGAPQIDSSLFKEFGWRLLGPASPAGRVWQITGVESDPKTFYVCTAGGNLWKSANNGTTLVPIFEKESSASTGAVAVAKTDPNIVWLGSGEPASTRANSWGDGVYKSTDAGATWTNMGITDSRQISAVVIHPSNPDIVYVAAMGYLWGKNAERGIFKTTDGGKTWAKSLFINDTTGCIDLQMDPANPEILYAAGWQRFRFGGGDMAESGPGSGIYKSEDGGKTWVKLAKGLPTDDMGKITISVARHNTKIVYAAILTGEPAGQGKRTSMSGGVFRSEDGGESWQRVNPMMTSYYYQRIFVDPGDDDRVWMPVFDLMLSTDGAKTFAKTNIRHVHNDTHALWIDPKDPQHMFLGGDGGVNITYDRGATWQQAVLPIGQFYEVDVDNQDPYHVYGGMQDTGHWLGPSQTYDNEGITNHDWIKLRFNGDGMAIHADPADPNIIYMVQEFGNFSRLDLRTWDRAELQPEPDEAKKRGLHTFRYDWTPPMIISRHDPSVLYFGSNYLFKFTGRGDRWEIISPDLSRQQDKTLKGVKDGYHSYGALFSIAESPLDRNIIWAGADDGPIHVTRDGGKTWTEVSKNSPPGAPTEGVVAEIEASRFDKATAYVAYDNHTREDIKPYLYKTTDYGRTWVDITGNLGAARSGSAYVIKEDPVNRNLLYVGAEFGVYFTLSGGGAVKGLNGSTRESASSGSRWFKLQNNLPTVSVRAMAIQERDKELVIGTFGRAIWVTDIAPFQEMTDALLNKPAHLFDIKPGTLFKTRFTYGATIEELNGDMFFRAENPPYGTMISYYLKQPAVQEVTLVIQDASGKVVRTLTGPATAGIHRVNWDLKRQEKATAEEIARARAETISEREALDRVPPGNYTVTLRAGSATATKNIVVRKEIQGVRKVDVRK
jgi:photosystem II stability/assembly factor-like uncharacterized protein